QVLLGALSYLIPVVLGGGPSVVRATTGMLDKGWAARVTIVNLGLLAWSVVPADRARVPSALLVIGVLALFLPLCLRSVLIARRSTVPSRGAGESGGFR
ncbi:MAG: hypothetical protein LH461_08725, partial [Spirochaetaceae bacterium]|nr:hypothetical protein [Spirochaetaceae bacterium]